MNTYETRQRSVIDYNTNNDTTDAVKNLGAIFEFYKQTLTQSKYRFTHMV